MSATPFSGRENNNNVLFTFDSVVDISLGIILALQKDFPSGGSTFLDYSFLSKSPKEMQEQRRILYGEDIVERCFLPEYRDKAAAITRAYRTEDRVIQFSPVNPAVLSLIHSFTHYSDQSIRVTLLGETQLETRSLRRMLEHRCPTIRYVTSAIDDPNLNLSAYGRVVFGDFKMLDKLANPPKFRHLTILNYGSNLQLVDGKPIIMPEYLIKYGDINQIELLDLYNSQD